MTERNHVCDVHAVDGGDPVMDVSRFLFVACFNGYGQPVVLHGRNPYRRVTGYLRNRANTSFGIAGKSDDVGANDGILGN